MTLLERPGAEKPKPSIFDRYPELKKIPPDRFPKNVFIVPDGNGRWATLNRLAISAGHQKGAEVVAQAFDDFNELREYIPFVGVWGFSMDNLSRPQQEVDFLMDLFNKAINRFSQQMIDRKNRFIHVGRKDVIDPYPLGETVRKMEAETRNNYGQVVYIAIGYSGEDQETRMFQEAVEKTRLNPDLSIDRSFISSLRDGRGDISQADLLIRSSGEQRLSDLGWIVGKGTELYFDKDFFPAFTTRNFVKALADFSKRERRFGGRPQASI